MKIALAQLNPRIADFEGNLHKARGALALARRSGADLVVFPECFVTGYPPRDLLEREDFMNGVEAAVSNLLPETHDLAILLGCPWRRKGRHGRTRVNGALLLRNGKIERVFSKTLLPEYDVFDEARYFEPADPVGKPAVFEIAGKRVGVTICEDLWDDLSPQQQPLYGGPSPLSRLKGKCNLLVNLAASPFDHQKLTARLSVLSRAAKHLKVPVVYVNQVAGQDELVFDGRSLALDSQGRLRLVGPAFGEQVLIHDPDFEGPVLEIAEDQTELLRQALVLGLKDYFQKSGFEKAVLGLSGGIDSAVVAVLAAEALGPERVTGVTMPSHYSSSGSVDDSRDLAARLGIAVHAIPITGIMQGFDKAVLEAFRAPTEGLTHENLQSRIRGLILMAFSNKEGSLVLNTGNKSELAMGYCTLYGDMNGGLSVLGDVYKTRVYELARHLNRDREIIPQAIIDKEPSAELRPDQKDSDSLPPYPVLDAILKEFIEGQADGDTIARKTGLPLETVKEVVARVPRHEYKRFQTPPVIKVTPKAFGSGRRIPLARKI